MKRALRKIVTVLVVLALGFVMIKTFVRQNLYPTPHIRVPATPPQPLHAVELETSAGDEVIAWFDAAEAADAPSVLFFHGNGENLATFQWAGGFERFRELDPAPAVLAVDYPGYGRSTGRPGEEANVAAAVAAHEWLVQRRPEAPVVVMGWSLGAAVAAQLVPRVEWETVDGLVLASAWHDLSAVAKEHFPGFLIDVFLSERYDSGQALETVLAGDAGGAAGPPPVVMIHGAADRLIPPQHGRRLFERLESAGADVRWVEVQEAGHNDLMARRDPWKTVEELLREVAER